LVANLDNIMREAYDMAEDIKECTKRCDVNGAIALNDVFVPCPLLTEFCMRGQEMIVKLGTYSINSIDTTTNLPKRFHELFKNYKKTKAVAGAKNWNRKYPFLMFSGPSGSGKSFGAAYALYVLTYKINDPNWKSKSLWKPLNALWLGAYMATSQDDLFKQARTTPILVLDDVGEEMPTNLAKYRIAEIISERWNHNLLTIITTSLSTDKLIANYGARAYSRISKDGQTVICDGDEVRLM